MRKLLLSVGMILTLAFTAVAAQAAPAQGYSPAAKRVLAAARAAAGGSGWNYLRGWRETGREDGAAYETWLDPLRYGLRTETRTPAGLSVHGFNGFGDWRITAAGAVTGVDDKATIAQSRSRAFIASHGFFFPGRFDARGELVGRRRSGGRAFDVVGVHPWGGARVELWFDARSHLLTRTVEYVAGRAITTELSDYRRVGPVQVAFRTITQDPAAPAPRVRQIETLIFTPADRSRFSLPRPTP